MPKSKIQQVAFSILMSFAMVYGMETYNRALINHGLTGSVFLVPLLELILLMLVAMVLQKFVAMPFIRKTSQKSST